MTVDVDKLVKMAEQITANMQFTDDQAVVAAKVAEHLNKFWDPRMKAAFVEYAAGHEDELSPALRAAVPQIHAD